MTRVFNLFIPLPNFINELSPKLAREAMIQISNAKRIHKLHMVTSFSIAVGLIGTVANLIWSKVLLKEDSSSGSKKGSDWVCLIKKSWDEFTTIEYRFSCTAIIISIAASVVFFRNFMAYRTLQRFQVLYFSKLEGITKTL